MNFYLFFSLLLLYPIILNEEAIMTNDFYTEESPECEVLLSCLFILSYLIFFLI